MQLQCMTLHADRVRRKCHHSRTTVIKYWHMYCNIKEIVQKLGESYTLTAYIAFS